MNIKAATELLSHSKHRVTQTRRSLLQTIFKLQKPFSAYDILHAIPQEKGKTMDLVTIYRNLHVLEELGILCRADFSDEIARYVVSKPGHQHHHHHIVCRSCQQVEALDFCIVEAQEQVLEKLGFKDISHRLEFSGLCPTCS